MDDREDYEAVFAGVTPVLHKVEILQIEMLDDEIGRHGMIWIMDTFLSHDFVMLGGNKTRSAGIGVPGVPGVPCLQPRWLRTLLLETLSM